MRRSIPSMMDRRPNVPVSGARILFAALDGVRVQFSGTDDSRWLDVPTFVEIAQSVGVEKGGILPCQLIWILGRGGHRQLVRVGSAAHKNAVDKDELRWRAPIKGRDLKVGSVYRSLSGWGLFLGHMDVKPINLRWPVVTDKSIQYNRMLWCVFHYGTEPPIVALKEATTLEEQFKVLDAGQPTLTSALASVSPDYEKGYRFEVKASHQYRKLITGVELTAGQAVAMLTECVITKLESETDLSHWFRLQPILAIAVGGRPKIPVRLQQALRKQKYTYIGEDTPLEMFPELLVHENSEVRRCAKGMFAYIKKGVG